MTLPEKDSLLGTGGELHQQANAEHPPLTTQQGVTVPDNQNSLRAHPQGPTLLEDFILREKITHFDHERIPERIVHARGSGAHGFFELTHSLEEFTTAKVLTEVGVKTPVFARFSTVAGGSGSVDTPRDVRGFAVKLYTKEGNWDLVGNNIPVFFIQDAVKFPDLVHAVKMEPDRGYPQSATAHDILVADGSDGATITAIRKAALVAGARVKIVAPRVGGITLASGKRLDVDGQLAGTPSVMFDAVALVLSGPAGKALCREAAAVDFVRDAFGHLKAIAADAGAQALLMASGIEPDPDPGVLGADDVQAFLSAACTRQWAREKSVRTLA